VYRVGNGLPQTCERTLYVWACTKRSVTYPRFYIYTVSTQCTCGQWFADMKVHTVCVDMHQEVYVILRLIYMHVHVSEEYMCGQMGCHTVYVGMLKKVYVILPRMYIYT